VDAALPGEHGALVALSSGSGAGLVEAAVTVAEQGTADLWPMHGEHRVDVHLVPEDVTAVPLTVQAAGGHSRVEVDCHAGHGLQHVEGVEVECELLPLLGFDEHRELVPELPP